MKNNKYFSKNNPTGQKSHFSIITAFFLCVLTAVILSAIFTPFTVAEEKKEKESEITAKTEETAEPETIPTINTKTFSVFKHNNQSFTEGLTFAPDGRLYETGGRYYESKLFYYNKNPNVFYKFGDSGSWLEFFGNLTQKSENNEEIEEVPVETKDSEDNRKKIVFEDEKQEITEIPENYSEDNFPYILDEKSVSFFPDEYFAEGVTALNEYLYILTWKEQKIFKYDISSESIVKTLDYAYEGWGLTNDGKYFYASDGSNKIHVFTISENNILNEIRVLNIVDDEGNPVLNINELEYIDGYLFANIWKQDNIVVIDIEKQKVIDNYDFSFLRENETENSEVLNGIAYDENYKTVYLTGKNWNWVYGFKMNVDSEENKNDNNDSNGE